MIARSPEWDKVEKSFLLKNPICIACTRHTTHVQVHHIFPFHYCVELGRPDLELDFRNLVTLCETTHFVPSDDHHLLLGHLDDFKSANLSVRDDIVKYKGWNAFSIRHDPEWIIKRNNKLKALEDMTDQEKEAFKELMNRTYT